MKIYLDQGEIGDLRMMVRRRGEFLTILHGINLSHRNGKLEISPLYQPLLHWRRHSGQVVIVIGFTLPLLLIVVQPRRPFVHIEVLKEEEE
jgi:hypothetical protein